MSYYCIHCGSQMSSPWLCSQCVALPRASLPGHLAGKDDELRVVVALFADVVGSTSIGETLGPGETKSLIGECVSRMTEVVEGYGGVVRAFMGDGIAAFFGLDLSRDDDSFRAALAALDIVEAVRRYAEEVNSAVGVPALDVRVALNAGRVGAGYVGASEGARVALGDPVNVAARLQGLADPGTVLVGESVVPTLTSHFDLVPVGKVALRGRLDPVGAWVLQGRRESKRQPNPTLGLVGRESELKAILSAADELALGRGQVVMVPGEAGVGKSRLIAEAERRFAGTVRVLGVECVPGRFQRPYGPVVDLARQWIGVEARAPNLIARLRLQSKAKEILGSKAAAVISALEQVLGLERDGEWSTLSRMSSEALAKSIVTGLTQWFRALAESQPTVVVLDNLERGDTATIQLFRELLRLTEQAPLMLVAALRPEPGSAAWAARVAALAEHDRYCTEIRLAPLGDAAADALISSVDSGAQLPGALRRRVHGLAGGNPLFIIELTKSAMAAATGAGSSLETLQLPPVLESVLMSRIDRVPSDARPVMKFAAMLSGPFSEAMLESAYGAPYQRSLRSLVREGIVREAGRGLYQFYDFSHGLFREVILGAVPAAQKQELHRRVARALLAVEGDEALEAIASHYLSAGDRALALEFLERAADRAVSLARLVEARSLLQEGLALCDSSDREHAYLLTSKSAGLATALGLFDEAVDEWQSQLKKSLTDSERAEVIVRLARTELERGRVQDAVRLCDEASTYDCSEATEWLIALTRSKLAMWTNEPLQAAEVLGDRGAPSELDSSLALEWNSIRAGIAVYQGDFEEASRLTSQNLLCAKSSGTFSDVLKALRDVGMTQYMAGRLREASETLADVYRQALESGHTVRVADAATNLSCVWFQLGDLMRGLAFARSTLDLIKSPLWRSVLLENLSAMEFEVGATEEAYSHVRLSEALAVEEGASPVAVALARLRHVNFLWRDGYIDESRACLADVHSIGEHGRSDLHLRTLVSRAELSLESGEIAAALKSSGAAMALLPRTELCEAVPALRVRGMSLFAAGHRSAGALLQEARERAADAGMKLEAARASLALARVDPGDRKPLLVARQLFADCGSERGLMDVRKANLELTVS